MKKCPLCGGVGILWVNLFNDTCSRCEGTGKLCDYRPRAWGFKPCDRASGHVGPCRHEFTWLGNLWYNVLRRH